jgi:F-type H+-transporting ATPase subunit a
MPEHTTFISYLLYQIFGASEAHAMFGHGIISSAMQPGGGAAPSWHSWEPILTSILVILVVVALAARTRAKLSDVDSAVVPDDKLTLRTFMEAFVGFFYDMTKDVMGPKRAKKYFPVVGAAACFIFFSNLMTLVPGFSPPTSSLNITVGCALVVFILFNFYGLQANGMAYIAHLAGPKWYLAPLIFPIEVISTCVRPVTLSIRLMVNMAVDHLLGTLFLGLVALFVPIPLALLGIIVIVVQTLVFSLLTAIYIGLATEHDEHGPAHAAHAGHH